MDRKRILEMAVGVFLGNVAFLMFAWVLFAAFFWGRLVPRSASGFSKCFQSLVGGCCWYSLKVRRHSLATRSYQSSPRVSFMKPFSSNV